MRDWSAILPVLQAFKQPNLIETIDGFELRIGDSLIAIYTSFVHASQEVASITNWQRQFSERENHG
jgi:hypothetical protein